MKNSEYFPEIAKVQYEGTILAFMADTHTNSFRSNAADK